MESDPDNGRLWPATNRCRDRLRQVQSIAREVMTTSMHLDSAAHYVRRCLEYDRHSDEYWEELDDVGHYLCVLRQLFQQGASACLLLEEIWTPEPYNPRPDEFPEDYEPKLKRARIKTAEDYAAAEHRWDRDPELWVDRQWEGC